MKNSDGLGIGLYSLGEAARLLRTPRRTLSRWVEGYVHQLRSGPKSYLPVIDWEDGSALTFGDLVELMYVRGFRDGGVALDGIRRAARRYREEWSTPYPLATKRFATDGRNLLIQEGDAWRHALSGRQQAFFDELGARLIHTGDLTREWRPLGSDCAVLLNPERSFGKPIDDLSGACTFVLAQAAAAGDSPERVAWWYGTTASAVLDTVRFEDETPSHSKIPRK